MALVKQTVSTLINGISQQPDAVRLDSQAEEQLNGLSDVVDGVRARPTSTVLQDADGLNPTSDRVRLVPITATDGVDYVAGFDGNGNIQVWDSEGVTQTVNITVPDGGTEQDVRDYISLTTTPRQGLDMVSVGSALFVANRDKAVALDPELSPDVSDSALIWVRQGVPGQLYEISVTDFELPYPGAALDAQLSTDAAFQDAREFVTNNFAGLGLRLNEDPSGDYDDAGNEAVNKIKPYAKFTSDAATGGDIVEPGTVLKNLLGEFNATIFYTGTDSLASPDAVDESSEDLTFNSVGGTWIQAMKDEFVGPGAWSGVMLGDQPVAMISIREDLVNAPFYDNYKDIRFLDTTDGSALSVAHRQVAGLEFLPYSGAPIGFSIKVDGDTGAPEDDFYVVYDGETWRETVGPNLEYKFDLSSMPHVLERQDDGTWNFGQGDWAERDAGDAISLPPPSFVGKSIRAMAVHRNRLCFATDNTFVLSETGALKNFWGTTAREVLDTDPIDIEISNAGAERAAKTEYLLSLDRNLIGFGQRAQVVLEGSGNENSFTPATVGAEISSYFDMSGEASPVLVGGRSYFVSDRGGNFSSVYEYGPEGSRSGSFSGQEMTIQVPEYIPGDVDLLEGSNDSNMVIAQTKNDLKTLYVYRQYYTGDQKVQASWSTWSFETDVLDLAFRGDQIFLVTRHPASWDVGGAEGLYFERIDLSGAVGSTISPDWNPRVDNMRTYTVSAALNPVYTVQDGGTWIDIPEELPADRAVVVLSNADYTAVTYEPEIDGTRMLIKGNAQDGDTLVTGARSLFRYKLSKLYLKEQADETGAMRPVTTGRLQLKQMRLGIKRSGQLDITIDPQGRNGFVHHYSPDFSDIMAITGNEVLPEYDYFDYFVGNNAQTTNVLIENDYVTPSTLVSFEWVANYREKKTGRG